MWLLLIYLIVRLVVPRFMILGSWIIRIKRINIDAFECGFDSFNVRVFPVSLRFFVFCIIFLILDLELIIISVTPLVIWWNGFVLNILVFLILVTVRILLEWLYGRIRWVE